MPVSPTSRGVGIVCEGIIFWIADAAFETVTLISFGRDFTCLAQVCPSCSHVRFSSLR